MIRRVFASVMIALFVNFIFADTLFLHSHRDSLGHSITHSHPYCPQSSHTHSPQSLDQIAGFNLAAACMREVLVHFLTRADVIISKITYRIEVLTVIKPGISVPLRAPPFV